MLLCCMIKCLVLVTKTGSFPRSHDPLMNEVVFSSNRHSGENNMDDLELPMFDFKTITMATNNFSEANKIGQGGFGSVYKVGCFYTYHHNSKSQSTHSKLT